jgi:outer membrane protein assembly factor BamB
VLWQTDVASTGVSVDDLGKGKRIVPHAIAVDASGDVVVAADDPGIAVSPPVDTSAPFRVLKFSGTTGAVLWDASAPEGQVRDLALLGHDVVVAAKRTTGLDQGVVMRLSSATGSAVWSHDVPGPNSDATSIAVDSVGDVVFAGRNPEVVTKLARNTGNEIWSSPLPAGHYNNYRSRSLRIDSADDVVVAGRDDPDLFVGKPFVIKLSGASGGQLWLTGSTLSASPNFAIALDGSDNVLWAKQAAGGVLRLIKLAAGSGTTLWSTPVAGIPTGAFAADVVVKPGNDPVVGGQVGGGHSLDFTVFRLSGHDGSCFGPHCVFHLAGALIKALENPQKKWLITIGASGNPALPIPPPLTDSDPTDAGAVLTLFNPTTMEYATFVLPPGRNWQRLGPAHDPGSKGYLYEDKLQADGPCSMLKMVPGKTLTVKCSTKDGTAPFSFDEPTQGTLAALLQIGEFEYCLTTDGGTVIADRGVQGRKPALFKARNAPAPDSCPLLAR